MKKFLSGVLCATLVFSLALSALAISGKMTIEVDPVNVQVNGEVFQPTDVTGKEVPVFAYQGTTYAPLRALAEAYGLEVGYDAAANMATVTDPDVKTPDTTTPDTTAKADYSDWSAEDEAAYQEFKGMLNGHREDAAWQLYRLDNESLSYYRNVEKEFAYRCLKRMIKEAASDEERLIVFKIKNEEYSDAVDQMLLRICSEGDKVKLNVDVIWDNLPFELGHQWADIEI